MQMNRTKFFKRTLIVVAVAVVPVLIWYLFDVILVAFGAIILAMLMRLGAQPFIRWASIPEPFALVLSGVLIFSVVGGAGYLFGSGIVNQFQEVVQRAAALVPLMPMISRFGSSSRRSSTPHVKAP